MEFQLTDEQLRWRTMARDFTEQVIKPDMLRDVASVLNSDGTNRLCLLRAVRAISSQDGAELFGF